MHVLSKNPSTFQQHLMKILPESRAEEFVRTGKVKTILASDFFVKAGEVPYKVAFISSGLFRYVYVNDRGDEFTKGIISEHHFLSSYSAMIQQKPSFFSIEALEDSEILEVNWSSIQQLMETDVFWVRFLLSFVEMGFMIKEKRERDLLLLDAETRYENFLREFPGMDQRVKQVIVASYLGIKPETLSRIRRKIIS